MVVLQLEECKNKVNELQPKDRKIKEPEARFNIYLIIVKSKSLKLDLKSEDCKIKKLEAKFSVWRLQNQKDLNLK